MKAVLTRIIDIISIVIIVGAVFILLSTVMTGKGDIPNIAGYSMMRVLTGSMEPAIPTDSLVLVKRIAPEQVADEIHEGDVISFFSSDKELKGAAVTHRVAKVFDDGGRLAIETRGDANVLSDRNPTYTDKVIGKVVFTSHVLGVITQLIVNPLVFFILIIIPLGALLIMNVRTTYLSTKEIMREEEEEAIRLAVEEYRKKREAADPEAAERKALA